VLTSDFATGAVTFIDTVAGSSSEARIFIPIRIPGVPGLLTAMVDTAASFCVVEGALAEILNEQHDSILENQALSSRLGRFVGSLCRIPITLHADQGQSVTVDSTVFLSSDWTGPTVIGYNGLLERLRFAVDPPSNQFFFGI
jgi:hypothetical protein